MVDVLRSDVRRHKMQVFVWQLCATENKSLVPIKGMPIRWNTTLAEAERALLLQPVSHVPNDIEVVTEYFCRHSTTT